MNTEKTLPPIISEIPLLKAEDVASLLNISLAFAYRLMQSGQIRTVNLGRAVRVRYQDLQNYIEQNIHDQAGTP